MNKADFLSELQDMLQLDEPVSEDTALGELEEWDSLAFMLLIAFFDKNFGQRITFEDLAPCKMPKDLIALAGGEIS